MEISVHCPYLQRKKIETGFEKPFNKLKNVHSILQILRSKLENLEYF